MNGSGAELPAAISRGEFEARRMAVLTGVARQGCDSFVAFDPASIFYLTGYSFAPTERPVGLLLDAAGDAVLWVPLLKAHHAEQSAFAAVESYREYPDAVHPMTGFAELVRRRGARRLVTDLPGYAPVQGYHGPSLAACRGAERILCDPLLVEACRMRKSKAEIELIKTACGWSRRAHELLKEKATAGVAESTIAGASTGGALAALRRAMERALRPPRPFRVLAGFGGQIGADGTAHHHQAEIDPLMADGDMVITQVGAVIGGYHAELERTMVIGVPTDAVRDLFGAGEAMHEYALGLVGPGIPCSEIDKAVRARFDREGLSILWRHHTGHGIGLLPHEAPFLDVGDSTVLEPGMLVTVEPGLYRDGVGGFRHSDCVLVTEAGCEVLTDYPRDLASLSGL